MSVIRVDNFGPSAGGTTYSARGIAKAWVNFNGTGTIASRDSENVSSLTDNATGIYTVSFSVSFSAADYSAVAGDSEWGIGTADTLTTGSVRTLRINDFFNQVDPSFVYLTVDGDLA
jgi:hypothetical protein